MHLWCSLIPQAEKQLLLLRQTNINPKISDFAYLYGPHDYNSQPFVPIGMEAMIHDKLSRRKTFAQHCSKGIVIGSSPEHYRCRNLWTTSTKATRVSGTVFFKHNYITNPETTPESFQLQMRFSFPFLRANDLRLSLLNIRARSFLLSCT